MREAARCITDRPFVADGYSPSARSHSVSFLPIGNPVLLDSKYGRRSIGLNFGHLYRIDQSNDPSRGRWSVRTVAYFYEITDREGNELFAYHWDPDDAALSWAKFPHMHVSGRLQPLPLGFGLPSLALGELHFPTERIAFETLVRMLIQEFEVAARRPEREWRRILDAGETAFRRQREE